MARVATMVDGAGNNVALVTGTFGDVVAEYVLNRLYHGLCRTVDVEAK